MAVGSIACIDIGSSKICTVIANVREERIGEVLAVSNVASEGVQKGIIVDQDGTRRAIEDSVRDAEATALKVKSPVVGFGGRHIDSTNTRVHVDIRPKKGNVVDQEAKERAWDEIRKMGFAESRIPIFSNPRQWFIDQLGGIRNPLGMHGYKLDLEAHIVTAERSYLDNLQQCLDDAGVENVTKERFIPNPLASAMAVLEPDELESGVILADIGAGTTGIAVFKDESIWYTSGLAVGGRHITHDLAIGLNIPFSAAEELKVRSGTLYPEEMEGARAEVLEKYRTSPEELSYIMRARVEEILRMIVSKPPRSFSPPRMVITGGTANLPGLAQFATREVVGGLPVRIGMPGNLPVGGEALNDPAYAAVVGLLLLGEQRFQDSGERGAREGPGLPNPFSTVGRSLASFWRQIAPPFLPGSRKFEER